MNVLELDPAPALLKRLRSELAALFDAQRPIRVSRAPGRLDVMGGIADYTGSLVCEMPLGVGTAVAIQERHDRQIHVVSLNLLDEHVPFQLGMSLDALAAASAEGLRRELAQPGRKWAGYVLGCLFLLHEKGHVDLADPRIRGLNIALYSTVPSGGGVSSSAALEVATMVGLVDHFAIASLAPRDTKLKQIAVSRWEWEGGAVLPATSQAGGAMAAPLVESGMRLARLCQEAENRIVGAPCGIMDQVTCHLGQPGMLLRLLCQPHELLPPLPLPEGVKVAGIFTGVRHDVSGDAYGRTRAAAFMGHRMILDQMRRLGREAGLTMTGDPTHGYLANLPIDDYKALFRPVLPETITGEAFLEQFGEHGDRATTVQPGEVYPVRDACDHHVLDAQRVRRFAGFLENEVATDRGRALRSAGRLMHASHHSYGEHARLGHPAADVIVGLVRKQEAEGLYGARITGGGGGGTVAVLMEATERADGAIASILAAYEKETGHVPTLLDSTSPGAAHVGTALA